MLGNRAVVFGLIIALHLALGDAAPHMPAGCSATDGSLSRMQACLREVYRLPSRSGSWQSRCGLVCALRGWKKDGLEFVVRLFDLRMDIEEYNSSALGELAEALDLTGVLFRQSGNLPYFPYSPQMRTHATG